MLSWLRTMMYIWLVLSAISFIVVVLDTRDRSVGMPIMKIVWPLTTLYMGVFGLYAYCKLGRNAAMKYHAHHEMTHHGHQEHGYQEMIHEGRMTEPHEHHAKRPFWQSVFVSSTHCGGGCALGDAIGAPLVFAFGLVVVGSSLFADYIVEFVLAYIFGVAFQYFGMGLSNVESLGQGLKNAIRADTLSLIAYEFGMFGWMALVHVFFIQIPEPTSLLYWFMMQVAMMLGFITSYPANWILVRKGIKHAM